MMHDATCIKALLQPLKMKRRVNLQEVCLALQMALALTVMTLFGRL